MFSRRSLFGLVGGGLGALVARVAGVESAGATPTIEPPAPVRYYATITVSNNTTMFTQNIETLLAEERLAFPVYLPPDFSNVAII